MTALRGALAAAVTPLRDGSFDGAAVAPYLDFLAGHGLDGVLVLGTTGEGVLFSPDERREIAVAYVEAARPRPPGSREDHSADPSAAQPLVSREDLVDGLDVLSTEEREVIELRYALWGGAPQTLEEVGRALGATRERIQQIENETLKRLDELAQARKKLQVAVHCGAQTTWETALLAEHAAGLGADAVAVIAPPYFALDEVELLAHFEAAASACAPTPFYLYEFEARSGYAIPLTVIERLRERAPNLVGMKVSDSPWERLAPYLVNGLDVFVGAEALLSRALGAGAAGAVSGLASSFPDAVVPLVREPTPEAGVKAAALRAELQRFPFHAASKAALGLRGVAVGPEVREPLRGLTDAERAAVEGIVRDWQT